MTNSIDRAKIAVGAKSDSDLARWLGLTQSVMTGYRRRETVPLEQCIKIAEQTGVSLDWLILGKGNSSETLPFALDSDSNTSESPASTLVPLYNVPASAGHGSFFDSEHIIQYVPFDNAWIHSEHLTKQDLICLPIKGDSMAPNLMDGDIVLIDRARTHGDGVFVIRIGDALRIKRLQWLASGALRISSDNTIYREEELSAAELEEGQFAIIGFCHTKIGRVF